MSGHRVPTLVWQEEVSECGLACVCMVANAFGADLTLEALRQSQPVAREGVSLADIEEGQREPGAGV